jgi:hypothetical protein
MSLEERQTREFRYASTPEYIGSERPYGSEEHKDKQQQKQEAPLICAELLASAIDLHVVNIIFIVRIRNCISHVVGAH